MTREDAFEIWLPIIKMGVKSMPECSEALDMAITALKQEPCVDAISREDALMALTGEYTDSPIELLPKAIKRINALPPVTPQPNKWIPVSERLPEKNMACLVAVGKFNLTQMAMYSDLMGTIDHRIFYQGDYGYDSFEDITEYVKAWMPLPLPYKAIPTGAEKED